MCLPVVGSIVVVSGCFLLFFLNPILVTAREAAGHQAQVGTARGTEKIDEADERRAEHFAKMNARQCERWWWWMRGVITVAIVDSTCFDLQQTIDQRVRLVQIAVVPEHDRDQLLLLLFRGSSIIRQVVPVDTAILLFLSCLPPEDCCCCCCSGAKYSSTSSNDLVVAVHSSELSASI